MFKQMLKKWLIRKGDVTHQKKCMNDDSDGSSQDVIGTTNLSRRYTLPRPPRTSSSKFNENSSDNSSYSQEIDNDKHLDESRRTTFNVSSCSSIVSVITYLQLVGRI